MATLARPIHEPLFSRPVTLADASTIAVDAGRGNLLRVTVAASRTMGAPSSAQDGMNLMFQITQGGSGSNLITWNAVYAFGTAGAPTLTTTTGKTDLVAFAYNAGAGKWWCLGSSLGL
jgi:hypothetical protein